MAPHFILEYIDADFELALVDRKTNAQKSPEYLSINPTGRIPALAHNDYVLFESSAISIYIAENHPEFKLVPPLGSKNRGAFLQWTNYLASTLQNEIMLFEYADRYCSQESSCLEIKRVQEHRINDCLQIIDKQLAGKKFLLGEQITVCDFHLFMLSVWTDELNKPPLSFDNLARYLRTMAKLDSVRKVCETEGLSLDSYS